MMLVRRSFSTRWPRRARAGAPGGFPVTGCPSGDECLEAAVPSDPDAVRLRDSKSVDGPALTRTPPGDRCSSGGRRRCSVPPRKSGPRPARPRRSLP
ncbi:DUF397 domain-containing protein [Streptomyces sp. G35A]